MNFLDAFSHSSDEFGSKCSGFLKRLQSFSMYLTVTVLLKSIGSVEKVNAKIQNPNVSLASVMKNVLQEGLSGMPIDSSYNHFWETTVGKARNLYLHDPTFLRKHKPPRWLNQGSLPHTFSDPKHIFIKHMSGSLMLAKLSLNRGFQQKALYSQ